MGRSERSSVEVRGAERKARGDTHTHTHVPKTNQTATMLLLLLPNLLLITSLSFAQECRLREDASQLLSVDYYVDPHGTRYADEVAVTMMNGKKYSVDLFEEGCRRVTPINVQYKVEQETEWQEGGTRRQSHHLKDLDPCKTYLVRITVGGQIVKDFKVGPYYTTKLGTETSLENEENPHFVAATEKIQRTSTGMTSTQVKIEGPICAKTVTITILQEGADLNEEIKRVVEDNDPTSDEVEEVMFEDLQPCAEYRMMVDLFLNRKERQELETTLGDFFHDDTFFTLPDPDRLKEYFTFDNTSMKLSWNLTKFFEQPCAKANGLMPNMAVVGEKKLDADIDTDSCNSTVLEVTFGKEQSFQLSGCHLETLPTMPRSSALSRLEEMLDGDGSLADSAATIIRSHLNFAVLLLLCLVAFRL